MTATMTRG